MGTAAETSIQNNVVPIQPNQTFLMAPKDLDEAMRYADLIAKSDLVPKDYKGKPANCLIAMQMGAELGVQPMQAIQNIAVINGRPAVWGDLLPALAKAHPAFEYMNETFDDATMTATCEVKRRGEPVQARTFSWADAEKAKLSSRDTYKQYPKRMLQMRARGFAVRDVFPDALKGVYVAEDIIDLDPRDYSNVTQTTPSGSVTEVKSEFISEEQALTITAYIEDNELNVEKWLDYFEKHFTSRNIASIPVKMYEKVMSNLKKAVQAKNAEAGETQ